MENSKLDVFILNAAKSKTLQKYIAKSAEDLLGRSFDDPKTFDFIVDGCNNDSSVYDDISAFIFEDFSVGENEAYSFADSLKDSLQVELDNLKEFFNNALASAFDGIDRDGVAAAMNNLASYASSEADYFNSGDGSDQENSDQVALAIGVIGDLTSSLEALFSADKATMKI